MSEFNFDSVKSIIEEIARENGFVQYNMNVQNDEFTGINYSSNIIRVQIKTKFGEKQDINLLVKLTDSTDKEKRELFHHLYDAIYKLEFLAYTTILHAFSLYQETHNIPVSKQFTYPKFYKGGLEYLKEYMVLEDLSYQGFMMYDKKKPIDFEHGKVIMENMARYHAISLAMKEKNPDDFIKLRKTIEYKDCNLLKVFGDIIQQMASVFFSKVSHQIECDQTRKILYDFIRNSSDMIQKCIDYIDTEPYNVLCHGDIHINNMLFAYAEKKPEVCFIDWQWIRYTTPAADIVQAIFPCTGKKFREDNLGKLYDIYYHTLEESLTFYGCEISKFYPRETFESHLKTVVPFGIIFGILGTIMVHCKDGEAKKFDEITEDSATLTLTPEMYELLKGYAEDIEILSAVG